MTKKLFYASCFCIALFIGLFPHVQAQPRQQPTPPRSLEEQLNTRDSLLFDAVLGNCKIPVAESLFTRDFAYYQAKGELEEASLTPRSEFMDNIKKRCDGSGGPKVKRTTSSIQAFQLTAASAIQTGVQRFYLVVPGQADQLVETSRFCRVWNLKNGDWQIQWEIDHIVQTQGN